MKIIGGIIGGIVFLILVLVLIIGIGLDWMISLTLCTTSVLIGIIIIRHTDVQSFKIGSFSTNLVAPNIPTVASRLSTETDATQKFSPIIVANVETMSEGFKDFIVEIRKKKDKTNTVLKTASGIKTGLLWKMVPLVFEHTLAGIEYEIRICVQDINGNKSQYSKWVSKIAG